MMNATIFQTAKEKFDGFKWMWIAYLSVALQRSTCKFSMMKWNSLIPINYPFSIQCDVECSDTIVYMVYAFELKAIRTTF